MLWLVTEMPTRAILPASIIRLLAYPSRQGPLALWAAMEVLFFGFYLALKYKHSSKPARIPQQDHLDRQPVEPPARALEGMLTELTTAIGPDGDRAAEVTSWFLGETHAHPEWSELQWENVEEWLAWALWNRGRDGTHATELEALVGRVEEWVLAGGGGLPRLRRGYNGRLVACRLTLDALRCTHRPLMAYVITHLAVRAYTGYALRARGFVPRHAGGLQYWHLSPPPSAAARGSPRPPPLLFLAGMGVGLVSYLRFIDTLRELMPGREVVLLEIDYMCMRLPLSLHKVPSPEEAVLSLRAVLAACGAPAAHWIGHSFGTVVMSWVLRLAPRACVAACTFIDPIPFLLFKSNVAVRFVYRPPATALDRLVRYFVTEEIGISHALHRHFSWPHNLLDPSALDGIPTAVVLSEYDSYVPSHAVSRHLAHAAPHVLLVMLEAHSHSQFCVSPDGPLAVARAVLDADGRRPA